MNQFEKPIRTGLSRGAIALGLGVASLAGVANAQETATTPAATATPDTNTGIADIIVTAQKREQNLQAVPISITALAGDALVSNRVADVRDLNAVAPNLSVRIAAGGTQQANYSMRGVVTSGSAPGSDKGISVYIDGVYLQNSNGSLFELADVQRIEVLKGPQGTLFGRNATGGAISFITADPLGQFRVRQELTYGNYDQFRSKTSVDLPSWGPLSAAFTYLHSERRGDIRNLGAGTVWDFGNATSGTPRFRKSPKYLGDQNVEAFRAALKLDLGDLTVSYKYDYAQNHYTPEGQGYAGADFSLLNFSAPGFGDAINALLAAQPNPSILTQPSSRRPDALNNSFSTDSFTRNQGHNLTVRWNLNSEITLTNIFAYRKSHADTTYQLTGIGGLVDPFPDSPTFGQPFLLIENATGINESQWSNETQLNIDTDWFTLTAGYIHFEDRYSANNFPNVPNVIQFSAVPDFIWPANGGVPSHVRSKSDAWFVQPEVHLTDRLNLVLGARLTIDDKQGVDNTILPLSFPIDYHDTRPTFLAGLNYKVTDDILAYAKFSTGFISGGFLATRPFNPETAKSWEAGIKTDLFDRRLRSNLSVFRVRYNNLQFNAAGAAVGILAAPEVVVNGGDSKAWGFEWENTAVPLDGLTLTLNLGYSNFKYTSVNPVIGNIDTYVPVNRPKWTNTGAIQYDTREIVAGGHLMFRLDANYRSKTYLAFGTPSQAIMDATTTKETWILNGRVALMDVEVGGSKAQLALWGKNLTNNRQLANVSSFGFLYPASYERARTYGVDLNFTF